MVPSPRVTQSQHPGLPPRVGTEADLRVGSEWVWPALPKVTGASGSSFFSSGPDTPEEYNLSHSYCFAGGGVGKERRPREGVLGRQGTG